MEERIRSAVAAKLAELGAAAVSFAVEWPADMAHGDYAVNAAMAAAKALGKDPRALAEMLVPVLEEALGEDAADIAIAGPGFINITLSQDAVTLRLREAEAQKEQWGRNAREEAKRVLVEYSCPNPFKEMHIGHLMSTVIGEAIARLFDATGATVLRDSYGGDVGPHVAKALWGLRDKGVTEPATARIVDEAYVHGARSYDASEKAKAEIDALNVALYAALAKDDAQRSADERALFELWRKGREAALEAFRDLYRILDTHFDYFLFESETTPIGMRVVADELARGIFEESDGAVIYRGEKKGLHTLVFRTSRGTPTYEAKDIGLAFLKEERVPNDASYILTGMEQTGHFKVFLAALEDIAPAVARKTQHIPHGLLQLTTGKMASRLGNVITARGLVQEVIETALERNPDPLIAEQVAVGALKYMILRSAPGINIVFDPEKSLSLDGDSGPYLQYALVRAKSILAQAPEAGEMTMPEETYALARLIGRFPEAVKKAQQFHGPHTIAQYLTQLAGEWNSFYARERILGGTHEAYKLVLVRAFVRTMQNGLGLLGIPVPEKM